MLTAGFDADVRCVIDARPTKSEIRYVQALGRGLRVAPGKDRLVILDHAGNTQRLGFIDSIHYTALDDGDTRCAEKRKAERKAADIRICRKCKSALPRGTLFCGECGYEQPATTLVVETNANLVEFGTEAERRSTPTVFDQAEFYAELKGYAAAHRYDAGWAKHKFREKFGSWPNAPLILNVEPTTPGLKTRSWIKSRHIAFGRRRQHA